MHSAAPVLHRARTVVPTRATRTSWSESPPGEPCARHQDRDGRAVNDADAAHFTWDLTTRSIRREWGYSRYSPVITAYSAYFFNSASVTLRPIVHLARWSHGAEPSNPPGRALEATCFGRMPSIVPGGPSTRGAPWVRLGRWAPSCDAASPRQRTATGTMCALRSIIAFSACERMDAQEGRLDAHSRRGRVYSWRAVRSPDGIEPTAPIVRLIDDQGRR